MIQIKMDEYVRNYGQKEAITIMEKLNKSKLFSDNIQIALRKSEVPNSKIINAIINSISAYFLFAGRRKIYFASLFFLFCLYRRIEELGLPIDLLAFTKSLLGVCEDYAR